MTPFSVRARLTLVALGALLVAGYLHYTAPHARSMPLPAVAETIANSGGRYQPGGASLVAADCSGLVSVAQTLAMGEAPRRLGSTHTMLAGAWPHAIRGATPGDAFVVGVNRTHMVALVGGVRIEATCCGRPFRVGPSAADPFGPQFTQYRIDEKVLRL